MQTRFFRLALKDKTTFSSFSVAAHGEESTISDLITSLNNAAVLQGGTCQPIAEQRAAALLLPVDMQAKLEEQEAAFRALAAYALEIVPQRGQSCQVAALPIFLVLLHADRLVIPGDDFDSWSSRVNTAVLERCHHFSNLLQHHIVQDRRLFGTVHLHCFALGDNLPLAGRLPTENPHTAATLLRELARSAKNYLQRHSLQGWQLFGYGLLSLFCLVALALAGSYLGWRTLSLQSVQPIDSTPKPTITLVDHLRHLLRFDGYRQGQPSEIQWVHWYQDSTLLLEQTERQENILEKDRARVLHLANQVRSLRERLLFLGLVKIDQPPIPVVKPITEPVPTLAQIQSMARAMKDGLERSLLTSQTTWPEEMPESVVQELQLAGERAYEIWLEPVRRILRYVVSQRGEDKRESWLYAVRVWLPKEALPHLEEWSVINRYLQQQAGQSPHDVFDELRVFVEREQVTLDLERVKLLLPSTATLVDNTKVQLRLSELRLHYQEREQLQGITWNYRCERSVPVLGSLHLLCEYTRIEKGDAQTGLQSFKAGQTVSATVDAKDDQGRQWRIAWSSAEQAYRWWGLHIFTESPRLVPAEESDPRRGVLLTAAKWVAPSMAEWKLPDLMVAEVK